MEYYSNEYLEKYLIKEGKTASYERSSVAHTLENGDKLYFASWNGELYSDSLFDKSYKPIYEYNRECYKNIDICDIEENSSTWNFLLSIIGYIETI